MMWICTGWTLLFIAWVLTISVKGKVVEKKTRQFILFQAILIFITLTIIIGAL